MLSTLPLIFLAATVAVAQPDGPVPAPAFDPRDPHQPRLTGKRWNWGHLPEKADLVAGTGEEQSGYNNCEGKPSNSSSNCQTIVVNSIQDFCIFAPPAPAAVGVAEAITVAYCTNPAHGGRPIPPGALKSVQFLRAPSYIAITGKIDEAAFNIANVPGNGGELDGGGRDMRGNPRGALVYSQSLPISGGHMTQSVMWHEFIGNGMFCMKLCDNKAGNPRGLCRHTLDTYGCNINVPNSFPAGFLSCESDDQAPVAIGVTDIPASSKCTTYASTALYGAGAAPIPIPTGPVTGKSASFTATTTSGSSSNSGHPSSTTSTSTHTGAPDSASHTRSSIVVAAVFAGLLGLAVAA